MIFFYFLASLMVSAATYILLKKYKMAPTKASSMMSLMSFVILYWLNKTFFFDLGIVSGLVFGSSFVGMCSYRIMSLLEVLVAAAVYTLLFVFVVPLQWNIGGALGFCAFVSVLSMKMISSTLSSRLTH